MPIKINFKRTHRYNVSAKDLYVIRIFTLDGTCVEYTVSTTTTGRDALEYVAQRLDIEDICFFGFKYEDWSGESRWLFLNKSVKKQLDKHARQHALTLTVMLFIDNPQFISDSQLRRFFYLQLRQDVATGLLPVTLKLGIKLSAYSLQADFGDFVDVETTLSNWRERWSLNEGSFCGAFDLSTTEYVDDILWGYLHLQGVSQDNAIWYFLDEIRHIPRYGVRTFRGMTCRNEPAELGVSRNGINITTLEPQQRTTANLKWEHIKDLTYSRKTFTIQLLKKNKAVHFLFEDNENARYLWQFCIQMHSSYIEYWTRVKSAPQQPAIHVSEPPDILRGTELRCMNPESPMMNDALPEGSNSSLVPQLVTSSTNNPAPEMNHVQGKLNPVEGVEFSTDYTLSQHNQANEHRTFKIDPTRFTAGPAVSGISNGPQGSSPANSAQPFFSSSASTERGPLEPDNLALLAAMHEGIGGIVGTNSAADSEAGTLVGQWSVRSAADTLDSQMINQGCVTCLPGRECLRPAAGWFQPRVGIVATHSTGWNQSGHRGEKNARKQVKQVVTEPSKDQQESKSAHHAHHHRRHHHQQEQTPGPQISKQPDQRTHRTRQPKRQRQQDGKTISVSALVPRSGVPMGGVNVIIDGAPSSPSSLASSDTSSGHRIASSRASFSSTSSSCCSERVKKPSGSSSGRRATRHDEEGRSCSSSSSSTSSINSAAAEVVESNVAGRQDFDEGTKTAHFGFTAALCSVAHNIVFKPNAKFEPKQSCGTTNGSSTGSATLNTGRKIWNDLIHANHGGLRPLLSGFTQHHYRPQLQLKRQQAAADATLHEQGISLDHMGFMEGASGMDKGGSMSRTRKPRRNSGGHPGSGSGGIHPLHDFHRWLVAAKQRLPAVWTNTVANRGMTLQISAPLPSNPAATTAAEQSVNSESKVPGVDSKVRPLGGLVYCLSAESHEMAVPQTSQTGRLARSSSEACTRDLTGARGLRFTKNPSANFNTTPQKEQQSPFSTDSARHPSTDQLYRGILPGRAVPPTIHLYPPSPTQTSFGHTSPSGDSDPAHAKQLWSCGSHSEDSGCLMTQTDAGDGEQTGQQVVHTNERDLFPRCTSPESGRSNDPNSQSKMPLQRQGAFRVSPSWRLVPRPLNLTDLSRTNCRTLNVTEGTTTLSNLLFTGNPDLLAEEQHNRQQLQHLKPQSNQPSSCNPVVVPHSDFGLQKTQLHQVGKVNVNHLLEGLDGTRNGHFSAPPGTPCGRLQFVWSDISMTPEPMVDVQTTPIAQQPLAVEWHDGTASGTRSSARMNLSNYLATERPVNPESNLVQPHESNFMNPNPTNAKEELDSLKEGQQRQQQQTQHQEPSVGHPFNTLLTTSSSSEQSSTQRPPSSGPIHLLTHSDIHQLLSLTNIRETELAHRLLAEYRQALLQQQSLHTNSVSTPNLTASQELQMFSSSTAAEDIEEVEVDPIEPDRPKGKRSKHQKTYNQRGKDANRRTKTSKSRKDHANQIERSSEVQNDRETSDRENGHTTTTRRRRRRRKEPCSIDSPDYVNAAAFCGERCGAGERPLSLASSTDMESNGTFRVLSSLDTRTSSVACGSFGNLTAPGTSFGSAEDNGIDLIHGTNNATAARASTTTADLSPVQSVNLSWDQLSQRRSQLPREMNDSHGTAVELSKRKWSKAVDQSPPDLCLSSTYPNLCEEHQGQREAGLYSSTRQPGTFSNLSEQQHDPQVRRNIVVGEYENLESLSNEKLHVLRSLRQPVLPNRQTFSTSSPSGSSSAAVAALTAVEAVKTSAVHSDVVPSVSGTPSEPNPNGSITTLAYSSTTTATTTSVPASLSSSDSVSSSASSSSISSTATSSSSDLGCTAVISDQHIDPPNNDPKTSQPCSHLSTHPHSPIAYHGSRSCLAHFSQEQQLCGACMQHKHDCHVYHYHPENLNLGMLLRTRECVDQPCAMRKVLFVSPNTRTKRRGELQCPCKCHHYPASFITKSNSLRLNNTGNNFLPSTITTNNTTAMINNNSNIVGLYEHSLDRKKARSFDPFARITCPTMARARQLTPVRFQPSSMRLSNSQSSQNCGKPNRRPHKILSEKSTTMNSTGVTTATCSKLRTRRLKPCLKTLQWSPSAAACLSFSDEDATEALCYLSDDEYRRTDDATSATESPCFSSASSYSFSTSSLDAQTEEVCPHYRHWYAPSCAPDSPFFYKEQERTRRGGSLDPSSSVQRQTVGKRIKRTSQPSSHRSSSHRKRNSEQASLISNTCSSCACGQVRPSVWPISCVMHKCSYLDGSSVKRELHQSYEEFNQSKSHRSIKTRQTPLMNPTSSRIPCRPSSHQKHHNDATSHGDSLHTDRSEHHQHHHRYCNQQNLNQKQNIQHRHHHHHTKQSQPLVSRSVQPIGAKPPVTKRKSNELRELTTADGTTPSKETTSESTIQNASAEVSSKLIRPSDLTLAPRVHDSVGWNEPNRKSSPGFGQTSPQKETIAHDRNSPSGSIQHTDRTPKFTGSQDLTTGNKRQLLTNLMASSIPRSPRTSPDLLVRPGSRCATSNDTETQRDLTTSSGFTSRKYIPSMIPSRARQSENYDNHSQFYASDVPSPLTDSANKKPYQPGGIGTSDSGFHSQLDAHNRSKTLQSNSSPVLGSFSVLLSPVKAVNKPAEDQWSSTRSPPLRQPAGNFSTLQPVTLNSPTVQSIVSSSQSEAQSQSVHSGLPEPTADIGGQRVVNPAKPLTTVTLNSPPRYGTPEEQRAPIRPISGLIGKLVDKKVQSSGSMIDSSSCASKSVTSTPFGRYDNGSGGRNMPHPVLSSTRYTVSSAKRA